MKVQMIKSKWFNDVFLESFEDGQYVAQDSWLKPWQYKNLMETVERNHLQMLSPKQWGVFQRNIDLEWSPMQYWGEAETRTRRVSVTVSNMTGFVIIKIYTKEDEEDEG